MKVQGTIRSVLNQDEILETVEVNLQFVDVPEQPGNQDVVLFYNDDHYFIRMTPDMKNTTKYLVWPVKPDLLNTIIVVDMDQIVE